MCEVACVEAIVLMEVFNASEVCYRYAREIVVPEVSAFGFEGAIWMV
jgi:hypothetical protein